MKLLLLVQSQSDVDHLDAAARSILNSAITGVWVVFSPAITINALEAAAKLDAEIEQLRTAERQAADRADYEAAKGYKGQRDGKELDRAKVLRDAWKTADEAARKARTKEIFEPFMKVLNPDGKGRISVKVTSHSDHYERDQWVVMLNSLTGVWFKPFTPGSFVVGWPEAVATSNPVGRNSIIEKVISENQKSPAEDVTEVVKDFTTLGRKEELLSKHTMYAISVAKKLGLDPKGKVKEQIVEEILAAEAGVTEPALAEY